MTALRRQLLLLPLALILAVSAALVAWRVHTIDLRMREDLMLHARIIARAVSPAVVAGFSGTEADLVSPAYQQLKEHLRLARSLDPHCRFLYLAGQRADRTVFYLIDSESPGSAAYSPPGALHPDVTALFKRVFQSGVGAMERRVGERGRTWVSALIPLQDPLTGRAFAVLGMDVETETWRMRVARRVLPTALTGFAIFFLGAAGLLLLRRRAQRPPQAGPGLLRHIEVTLAVSIGLAATGDWALMARENEQRRNWDTFCRLAASGIDALSGALSDIRTSELEGLARLFDASDSVDRREFSNYADFLARSPLAQAWEWVPAVAAADRERFEEAARRGGAPDFAIWQRDEAGQRVPAAGRDTYYPVCYVSPLAGNESVLGFDQGCDPLRRVALESALRTGLMTASDPVSLMQGGVRDRGILVFRPVSSRAAPGRVNGFAVVVLRMEILLRRALGSLVVDNPVDVEVHELRPGAPPIFLATTAARGLRKSSLRLQAPVFAFGKTYVVTCRPSPEFPLFYPARDAWFAGAAGLLLTTLVSILIAFLRNQQVTLERLVRERTEELRDSGARLNEAQRMARIGSWELDQRTRKMSWSGEMFRIFGVAPSAPSLTYDTFLQAVHPEDRDLVHRTFTESVEQRLRYDITHRLRPADGVVKFVRAQCETTYDEQCGALRSVGTVQDITDLKQGEAEREHLRTQLLHAQKMESIGRLAGGVAHDFNNMLQAIMGNASLALAELPAEGPMREYLEEIQKSAGRSADLARQLLAFASRQTVSPRVLDLNDTVFGMLKMLRRLIGEDIQLRWVPGADLWPVRMDPTQIDQILANLAVNARDAIGGVGQVTMETVNLTCGEACQRDYPGCDGGEYVQLSVSDNGRGMDAETREHAFEPFFTTKAAGRGTGLGLATVFGIVKQNKGHIAVDSSPGQGATFRILLPRAELPSGGLVAPHCPMVATRHGGESVLVVEDEPAILKLSRTALEQLGYTVWTASTPGEAIRLATELGAGLHLLVTDVVLPEMNGRDLVARIRAIKPTVRYLFMSGYTADVIAERGVLDEDVQFIQKPFSIEALAAKVREVLEAPPHA